MNALLTCVVINSNAEMAQDRIDDHARCKCLMGTVLAGFIAINPFYVLLRGPLSVSHLVAEALLDVLWVKSIIRSA